MKKYRTIWLSDIHLGTKGCQSDKLLEFLKHTESEYLILVGDILDFWALKRKSYWAQDHNTVIQKILKKSRHNTQVIFIPGNHDEAVREYVGYSFGNIQIHNDYTHILLSGKSIFCLHGDLYDVITRYHKWIAVMGDIGYDLLLCVNRIQNNIRKYFDKDYWSLSAYIKHKVKEAVNFISEFERNVASAAIKTGADAVLCGHIHKSEMTQYGNLWYLNTGDWVESCTAIVENIDGSLSLISFITGEIVEEKRIRL